MKLAKGETRPSQVNYEEPRPRLRDPEMPEGMDDIAQRVWSRCVEEMRGTGVIVRADTDILRAYAEAVSLYVRHIELLNTSGPLIRGARGGELVVNPMHRLVREDREAIRLLARELGLSPAARAGLRMDLQSSAPDIDEVLGLHPRFRVLSGTG